MMHGTDAGEPIDNLPAKPKSSIAEEAYEITTEFLRLMSYIRSRWDRLPMPAV
jgi:hypothetical protein